MSTELYFLGAGKPVSGDSPAALKNIVNNTRALDWQLGSFSDVVKAKDIYFLGGYHVDEVVELYPHLNFIITPDWQSKNALDTLLHAPFSGDSAFVTYSDTLFGKNYVDKLPIDNNEVLVVVDSLWKKRFRDRTPKDIANAETIILSNEEVEFTGLIYLNEQSIDVIRKVQKNENGESIGNNFQEFFNFLKLKGIKITYIDVLGDWAEFNSI
jgi:glutamine kinase